MAEFKPMVKMMTTEPSVELKLKKGGHVAMPKMKAQEHKTGSKKMAGGGKAYAKGGLGMMGDSGAAPMRPAMGARKKAMLTMPKAKPASMPFAAAEYEAGRPRMKKGGETVAEKLKKHADMPASKAHHGLKTGGVAMGQGGYKDGGSVIPVSASEKDAKEYAKTKMVTTSPDHSPAKTGDVKMGNAGGYKKGGMAKYAKGGGVEGNVSTTPAGVSGTKTGSVVKGQGGYKKGGALKKYADGGSVQDDGRPVKMPQGNKRPPSPVSINRLSGTYKHGGKVHKYKTGGESAETKGYNQHYEDERKENEETRRQFMNALSDPIGAMKKLPGKLMKGVEALRGKPGTVTKTEESVTVSPGKKRGGRAC